MSVFVFCRQTAVLLLSCAVTMLGFGAAGLLPHASMNSEGPHVAGDGCLSAVHANGDLSPAQNGHACEHGHEHLDAGSSPRAAGHAGGVACGLHHTLANGLANGHIGTPGVRHTYTG